MRAPSLRLAALAAVAAAARAALRAGCALSTPSGDMYDLSALGALTATDAVGATYVLAVCGSAPAALAGCSGGEPDAPSWQYFFGGCHRVAGVRAPLAPLESGSLGVLASFSGGAACGEGNRSLDVRVVCADGAASLKIAEGAPCHYDATVRTSLACPRACPRDSSGLVCGGRARGECVDGSVRNVSSKCTCKDGYVGPNCVRARVVAAPAADARRGGLRALFFLLVFLCALFVAAKRSVLPALAHVTPGVALAAVSLFALCLAAAMPRDLVDLAPPPPPPGVFDPFALEELRYVDERPRVCADGAPPRHLHLRAESLRNELLVSNFEIAPFHFLFGVRNLAQFHRTFEHTDEWMLTSYYDAARCAPRDDTVYDVWRKGALEEAALADPDTPGTPKRVILVLEASDDNSVAHTLWENGIFLRYFWALARVYPHVQLMLRNLDPGVSFMRLLLAEYKIPDDRVIWHDLFADDEGQFKFEAVSSGLWGVDNLVLFPPNTAGNAMASEELRRGLADLSQKVVRSAGLPPRDSCASRPTELLFLPRNSTRRKVHDLEVFSERVHAAVRRHGGRVVNAAAFTSIAEQAAVMGTARIVIGSYGSMLELNGLFLRGCTIIATNAEGQPWHGWMPSLSDVWAEHVFRYNRVFFTNNESEILDLLERARRAPPLPCPLRVPWQRKHYPMPRAGDGGAVIMPALSEYYDQDP